MNIEPPGVIKVTLALPPNTRPLQRYSGPHRDLTPSDTCTMGNRVRGHGSGLGLLVLDLLVLALLFRVNVASVGRARSLRDKLVEASTFLECGLNSNISQSASSGRKRGEDEREII